MRLVCPNCEAKYEVPEDAIPETGRDVQCANCGHSWYQMRPRTASAEAAPAAAPAVVPPPVAPPPTAEPEPVVEPDAIATPDAAPAVPESEVTAEAAKAPSVEPPGPEVATADAPDVVETTVVEAVAGTTAEMPAPGEDEVQIVDAAVEAAVGDDGPQRDESAAEPGVDEAPAATPAALESVAGDLSDDADEARVVPGAAAAAVAPVAYAVDDSVLAILREEAERETQARKAETGKPLEVQSDLGIDAAMPAARKPGEGADTAGALAVHAEEDEDDKLAARRTRLPDVEEINSTLRPSEQPVDGAAAEAMAVPVEARSSFRSGFLLVMTIAIIGMALYASADALASAVPALAGVLDGYVSFIDSLRLQLDGIMQSATVAMTGSGA